MDEFDCKICGYVQNKGLYHGVRKQRFNDHLMTFSHKLKNLILKNNGLEKIKKMKNDGVPSEGGCAICNYHPRSQNSYNYLMKRHMLSKTHFVRASEVAVSDTLTSFKKEKEEKEVPRFSIAKPTAISSYKNELTNLIVRGDIDEAIIVRQKIDSIENSQNFFKLVNAK